MFLEETQEGRVKTSGSFEWLKNLLSLVPKQQIRGKGVQ